MAGSRHLDANRRPRLEEAEARLLNTPNAEATLEDLAAIWGVHKTRFVSVYPMIQREVGWPAHRVDGRTHLYPALEAVQRMLAFHRRDDARAADMKERTARILGAAAGSDRGSFSANELAVLVRTNIALEEAEREQGLWIRREDVARLATDIFTICSATFRDLDTVVDPNGRLPADQREKIRAAGGEANLRLYAVVKDMIDPDAKPTRPRGARGGARRAPARR